MKMIINNNYLIMNENNLSKNPQTKVVDEKSKLKEILKWVWELTKNIVLRQQKSKNDN